MSLDGFFFYLFNCLKLLDLDIGIDEDKYLNGEIEDEDFDIYRYVFDTVNSASQSILLEKEM